MVHNAANAEADTARLRVAAGEAVRGRDRGDGDVGGAGAAGRWRCRRRCWVARWRIWRCGPARSGNGRGGGCWWRGTGYTGRTGSSASWGRAGGSGCGGRWWKRGRRRRGWAHAIRCGWKRRCRCTGRDISEETDPYAAGLGFAVRLDDGAAFTGREALAALKAPRRRAQVALRADGGAGGAAGGLRTAGRSRWRTAGAVDQRRLQSDATGGHRHGVPAGGAEPSGQRVFRGYPRPRGGGDDGATAVLSTELSAEEVANGDAERSPVHE